MKSFRIYRANKTNTGTASEWQLAYKPNEKFDKNILFLVVAKQTGVDANDNATFGWKEDSKITVKLEATDIGELLSVLERRKNNAKLYHESPAGGNKGIALSKNDNEDGYYLKVSYQDKEKKLTAYQQVLSIGDAAVLAVLLRRAIEVIFDW